jgi:hypothetical protein
MKNGAKACKQGMKGRATVNDPNGQLEKGAATKF